MLKIYLVGPQGVGKSRLAAIIKAVAALARIDVRIWSTNKDRTMLSLLDWTEEYA